VLKWVNQGICLYVFTISCLCMAMLREPDVWWARPLVNRFFLFWEDIFKTSSLAQCSHNLSHQFGSIHAGGKGFHSKGSSSSLLSNACWSLGSSSSWSSSSDSACPLDLCAPEVSLDLSTAANFALTLRFSWLRIEANCLAALRSNTFRHSASRPGAHL